MRRPKDQPVTTTTEPDAPEANDLDLARDIVALTFNVQPVIDRIDAFLTTDTNRTLIPQDEVRDFALDLRLLLTTDGES